MKKLFGMMILAAALVLIPMTALAQGEKLDFGKVTCAEFLGYDADQMGMFYFWLDGYVSAKSGNTVMDLGTVEKDMEQLVKTCGANKNATILKLVSGQ